MTLHALREHELYVIHNKVFSQSRVPAIYQLGWWCSFVTVQQIDTHAYHMEKSRISRICTYKTKVCFQSHEGSKKAMCTQLKWFGYLWRFPLKVCGRIYQLDILHFSL